MMGDMSQIPGDSYDALLVELREMVDSTARQAAALTLSQYPDRDMLNGLATMTRRALQSTSVQVNAIYGRHQILVGGSPHVVEPVSIPEADGLCTLTVGLGHSVAVNDISRSPITVNVREAKNWKSWASAPIRINGNMAGSICALEAKDTRIWTTNDQLVLERCADQVTEAIKAWFSAA